jgi:hypothetical protein
MKLEGGLPETRHTRLRDAPIRVRLGTVLAHSWPAADRSRTLLRLVDLAMDNPLNRVLPGAITLIEAPTTVSQGR